MGLEQSATEVVEMTRRTLAVRLSYISEAHQHQIGEAVDALELFVRAVVADEAQKMLREYLK